MSKLSPFEIASALNLKTGRMDVDEVGYNAFVMNRIMSNTKDTIFFANEMNKFSDATKQQQFDFYYYGLDKRKRYGKWNKKDEDTENIDLIKQYLSCSHKKALEVYDILIPHIEEIKQSLDTGGIKNGKQS